MTVSEVATILGVSSTTVLRMIRDKHLPATHACRNAPWIFRKDEVDNFLAASDSSKGPQTVNSNLLTREFQ